MSAGAVFKLIANDGKADRMIMATKLLNQRIKDVMCARKRAGKADITPTLVDLERTHIIFVNSHFKPFAAIGYEYNKVRPQSGSPNLGQGVTFSIPQFGDFFHDMVCRTRLSQFESSVLLTPVQSNAGTPAAPSLFPMNGTNADGTTGAGADGFLGSSKFYNLVDAFGNRLVQGAGSIAGLFSPHAAVQFRNLVRYCEWPGNRLFHSVKFDVNGNPLDQYDETVPVFLTKFCLPPNKEVGYKRLVGQEVAREGYGPVNRGIVADADASASGVSNTPAGIFLSAQGNGDGLFNNPPPGAVAVPPPQPGTQPTNPGASDYQPAPAYPGGPLPPFGTFNPSSNVLPFAALGSTPAPVVDYSRQLKAIVDGPQTPKPAQPPLEIWNKLRFWFNDDVRLSIASVSIPFGQRFITIELAPANLLAYEFPNLYLEQIVEVAASPALVAPSTIAMLNTTQRIKTYTPIMLQGVPDGPSVERMELYVNNIFVNPEVNTIASVL